ncbi:MAG: hypothetical protein IKQ00_09995 [Butyrivibrio sp.]|nr:hypothetical protein [Butyrivibrio sp.]
MSFTARYDILNEITEIRTSCGFRENMDYLKNYVMENIKDITGGNSND